MALEGTSTTRHSRETSLRARDFAQLKGHEKDIQRLGRVQGCENGNLTRLLNVPADTRASAQRTTETAFIVNKVNTVNLEGQVTRKV